MANPFNPPLDELEIQSIFPDHKDIEIIKSGGEGTVLKAVDSDSNKNVAIKIYSPDHHKMRNTLEVSKLLKIKTPYLVSLYDHGQIPIRDSDCYFTETTYVDGKDLRSLLDDGKQFTDTEVINVIKCVAQAIECLWKEKVVHCDIKPANILENNESFVLIDLGIAKYLGEPTMTAAGIIMGTMGYLAPEQFNGRKNITLKADYYALGILAYELLTGYHPFHYDQYAMLNNKLPSFPLGMQVNKNLKKLIFMMTDLLPYKRPKNYNHIIKILEEE